MKIATSRGGLAASASCVLRDGRVVREDRRTDFDNEVDKRDQGEVVAEGGRKASGRTRLARRSCGFVDVRGERAFESSDRRSRRRVLGEEVGMSAKVVEE